MFGPRGEGEEQRPAECAAVARRAPRLGLRPSVFGLRTRSEGRGGGGRGYIGWRCGVAGKHM